MQCAFGNGIDNVRFSYPFAPEAQPVAAMAVEGDTESDSEGDEWYCPYVAPAEPAPVPVSPASSSTADAAPVPVSPASSSTADAAPVPVSPASSSTETENSDDWWVVRRSKRHKGQPRPNYKC